MQVPRPTQSQDILYPACDVDWQPLHRFTHLCDTFVYCDFKAERERFRDLRSVIERDIPPGVELRVESVEDLLNNDVRLLADPSGMEFAVPLVELPWGKMVRLVRSVGLMQRQITLFYLRAEGVTLYTNLFGRRGTAPRVICLKRSEDGFGGCNWTTFHQWDGPLGRVVWDNPARPQIVIADDLHPLYDWPWNKVWQRHIGWISEMESVTSYVLPSCLPAPVGTPRREMRLREYDERRLVQLEAHHHPLIALETPRLNEHPLTNPLPIPVGKRDFPVWNQNVRLGSALQSLSGFCNEFEAERVGWSGGLRFEDEGPALTAWKNGAFHHPHRLTIHCQTEGDVYSFGPFADVIC